MATSQKPDPKESIWGNNHAQMGPWIDSFTSEPLSESGLDAGIWGKHTVSGDGPNSDQDLIPIPWLSLA